MSEEKMEIRRLSPDNNDGWIIELIIGSRDKFMNVPMSEKYKEFYINYLKELLANPFCYIFCRFNNDKPTGFRIFIIDPLDPQTAYIHATWTMKGETKKHQNIKGHEILEYALNTFRRLNVKYYYRTFPVTNEWKHVEHAFLDDPKLFKREDVEFIPEGGYAQHPGILKWMYNNMISMNDRAVLKYTDLNAIDFPPMGNPNDPKLKKNKVKPSRQI